MLRLWRYGHLTLAIISSLFLGLLAITGVILSIHAVFEQLPDSRSADLKEISLSELVPRLQEKYAEILSISVDHRGFVAIEGLDDQLESVSGYIDPNTGEILGRIEPPSAFISWVTALHRSLFLKETGRFLVAIITFLLILISLSGLALLLARQGKGGFFKKSSPDDFFLRYLHALTGRWALLPVLFIAFTGSLLYLSRMELFQDLQDQEELPVGLTERAEVQQLKESEFPAFKSIYLAELEQLDFPFIPGDPDEFYVAKLRDSKVYIDQLSGQVLQRSAKSKALLWEAWSLDQHSGRRSIPLAILLGLASLNILVFLYSGFAITLKRGKTKIKNPCPASKAEYILLYGSEGGTTRHLMAQVHRQLLRAGKKSYMTKMNDFQFFENAKHVVIFTSTYGLGEAPANADAFEGLLAQCRSSNRPIFYSVLAFGSRAYADFCAYGAHVDHLLAQRADFEEFLPLHRVNDHSLNEFICWVQAYAEKALIPLTSAPQEYQRKLPGKQVWRLVEKTFPSDENPNFRLVFEGLSSRVKYESGDLLAIYPAEDYRERLYSVGRVQKGLQLIVKHHQAGLGSTYLANLKPGDQISARLMCNQGFHLPKDANQAILIANGTGIAPFLGMVWENSRQIPIDIYAGFRYDDQWVDDYRRYLQEQLQQGKLRSFEFAFSREKNPAYVMNLLNARAAQLAQAVASGSRVMICGSLLMHRDVEACLAEILPRYTGKDLAFYKRRGQILSDCY